MTLKISKEEKSLKPTTVLYPKYLPIISKMSIYMKQDIYLIYQYSLPSVLLPVGRHLGPLISVFSEDGLHDGRKPPC